MSGSTADQIARSLDDEIVRDRVIAALDARWRTTLTLLSAPGGYGKTRSLAQAVRSNEEDPVGIDRYVRLRPAQADPHGLGRAILDGLEMTGPAATGASRATGAAHEYVEAIVDELASAAPTEICLILDDIHLVSDDPGVLDMIVELVRLLPTNAHLLLAGRSLPELPLARLRADDGVTTVDESDLLFDADELELLVRRHDLDPEMLAPLAGWPALVRLAVVAGRSGPREFLMQEIVDDLPSEIGRALRIAAVAGMADTELLERCGLDITPAMLAERVPLTDLSPDGTVRPHELWTETLQLADDPAVAAHVETIARWHGEQWRHDEAIVLATSTGSDGLARELLMDALDASDLRLQAASTGRWLGLFGGRDAITDEDAELMLLRGWHDRLALGPGHGDDDVSAALARFRERGDALGEARAGIEHAFRGFLAGDAGPVIDAVRRSPRLVEAGIDFLEPLGSMTQAVIEELGGDFSTALEHSQRALRPGMRPEFAELTLRHRSTLQFLVGDGDAAVRTAEELVEFAPTKANELLAAMTRFANGDVDDLVERWSEIRYHESGNLREDYIFAVGSVFIDACLGLVPDLTKVRRAAWDRPRERMQLALCEWSAAVIDGQEDAANTALANEIAELGIGDPLVEGEVRRFVVSCYVADPEVRSHLDRLAERGSLGAYHLERLRLARILVALRSGDDPDWSGYRDPAVTMSSMSLPWAIEIACGLVGHDDERGIELADLLLGATGPRARSWLRALADDDGPASSGAAKLLRVLPAPPASITEIRTQPTVVLHRDGDNHPVTRQRVRQLLLLLVLRESIGRDRAMTMLWPDKDIDNARNNFRITLSHLRDELEPDRRSGEPSFHLQQRGERVSLRRSNHLRADLWRILDGLASADAAAKQGDRARRLDALGPVADLWEPPVLADLADLPDVSGEVAALQARLRDATLEVAEAHLAGNRNDRAELLGRKLLTQDRYDERAHAVVIAASLGAGRDAQSKQAIDACLEMLRELDVAPAPATRMLLRRARYPEDLGRRSA